MEKEQVMRQISQELDWACNHFFAMKSPHEGLAIIREEYLELEAEVFKQHHKRDNFRMAEEARQLAAMAARFMLDLIEKTD